MRKVAGGRDVGWRKFCPWAREQGVRDARNLSYIELAQFAEHLSQQTNCGMRNSDARNLLNSVNGVFEPLRWNQGAWVRTSDYVGR